jgi:hypothetical protein
MTLRERLADWISGGALTRARKEGRDFYDALAPAVVHHSERAIGARAALRAIEAATASGKSGTARKINRMAREALK